MPAVQARDRIVVPMTGHQTPFWRTDLNPDAVYALLRALFEPQQESQEEETDREPHE